MGMFGRNDGRTRQEKLNALESKSFVHNGLLELMGVQTCRGTLAEMASELRNYIEGRLRGLKVFNKYREYSKLRGFSDKIGLPRIQEAQEAYEMLSSETASNSQRKRYVGVVRIFVQDFISYLQEVA